MIQTVRVPAGLRWTCHGCGSCCTGHDLGPVEDEVVARLESADIAASWPPAAAGWKTERHGPDGKPIVFLRQVDGACVFLGPDRRCGVHTNLGSSAKPGFCREFPYNLVEDPKGLAAVIRATCAGFHHSFRDGPLIGDADVDAVSRLPRVVPRARFAPERVAILPEQAIPVDDWMALEDAILAAVEREDGDPRALVAIVRRTLTPEAAPVRPAQYEAAIDALCHALGQVMRSVLSGQSGAPHQVAFARDALAMLDRARTSRPAPLTSEERAWLNLLLRSAILGKAWAASGSVAAGLGVWLAGVEIAARAGSLPEGVERWERFSAIPLVQLWLNKARPATVDVFLHA